MRQCRGNLIVECGVKESMRAASTRRSELKRDLTPQNRRSHMPSIKPVEEASQDFTTDLASLHDDVAKLSSSLSEFIRIHSAATTNTVSDVVGFFLGRILKQDNKTPG
jgi:hypothetical protein